MVKHFISLLILQYLILAGNTVFGQQSAEAEIHRNSVQKNLRIAKQLIDINEEDSALLHLNAILSRQLDNREAIFLRAAVYTNMKSFDKALADYNALLELEPENREATYSRGVIRYLLEQYHNALEDFEKASSMDGGETNTAYFRIDPDSQLASGISTLSKMEGDIWNYTGLCHLALQEYDKALNAFSQGIKLVPDMDDLYVNRALTYEALGNTELAAKDYEFVMSRNPANSTAEYNLLNLKGMSEAGSEQLASLTNFIEENPENGHAYASRGLFFFEQSSYDLALPDLIKACELTPNNADYIFNLALCHERLGDVRRAEAKFLHVIELDETNSAAYFNIGNIKFKEKSFEQAIAFYTLANTYNSENPAILYNRALAYLEMGLQDDACADMQQVQKIKPTMGNRFYSKYCGDEEQ